MLYRVIDPGTCMVGDEALLGNGRSDLVTVADVESYLDGIGLTEYGPVVANGTKVALDGSKEQFSAWMISRLNLPAIQRMAVAQGGGDDSVEKQVALRLMRESFEMMGYVRERFAKGLDEALQGGGSGCWVEFEALVRRSDGLHEVLDGIDAQSMYTTGYRDALEHMIRLLELASVDGRAVGKAAQRAVALCQDDSGEADIAEALKCLQQSRAGRAVNASACAVARYLANMMQRLSVPAAVMVRGAGMACAVDREIESMTTGVCAERPDDKDLAALFTQGLSTEVKVLEARTGEDGSTLKVGVPGTSSLR